MYIQRMSTVLDYLYFCDNICKLMKSGRSVTANMLALGASDSGFESRRPDKYKNPPICRWIFVFVGASLCLKQRRPGFEDPEYIARTIEYNRLLGQKRVRYEGCTAPVRLILPGGSIKDGVRRHESGSQNFSAEKYQ